MMQRGTTWASDPVIGQRPLPAWSLSLLLHLVLLVSAAYFGRALPLGAGPSEAVREVGVALVERDGDAREYVTREQAQQARAATSAAHELQPALPTSADMAVDLSGLMPASDDGSTAAAAAGLPSTGTSGGLGLGSGLSNDVRTSVFGASGSGNKFVYVFDRSGSMAGFGGRPLAAAQRELMASLQDLNDTTQFQIIFYNEEPHPFRFRSQTPRMVWGTNEAKEAAAAFVGGIAATGSTRHWQALKMALGLRPDVIFFLTDADEPQMTDRELRQVQRFNASATIHAIEFGYGAQRNRANFLVRLAEQNGGQHRYVDISGLASP
jgi:hypothetical protein